MVDPVWAGVVGALGGAAVGSVTSLLAPLIGWRVDRKQLEFEHEQQRERDRVALLRANVREWREGLGEARREYSEGDPSFDRMTTVGAGLVGRPWFESLRPYMQVGLEAIGYGSDLGDHYVEILSAEIARLEREWGLVPPYGDQPAEDKPPESPIPS